MSDLAEFLLARIAEDEAVARVAAEYDHRDNEGGHWHNDLGALAPGKGPGSYSFDYIGEERAEHAARHDPARVLAECESKRLMVARLDDYGMGISDGAALSLMRYMALPYATHPDYDPEWRPEA